MVKFKLKCFLECKIKLAVKDLKIKFTEHPRVCSIALHLVRFIKSKIPQSVIYQMTSSEPEYLCFYSPRTVIHLALVGSFDLGRFSNF